jgi:hypothetical protein
MAKFRIGKLTRGAIPRLGITKSTFTGFRKSDFAMDTPAIELERRWRRRRGW